MTNRCKYHEKKLEKSVCDSREVLQSYCHSPRYATVNPKNKYTCGKDCPIMETEETEKLMIDAINSFRGRYAFLSNMHETPIDD
jgi:hypothetical protein